MLQTPLICALLVCAGQLGSSDAHAGMSVLLEEKVRPPFNPLTAALTLHFRLLRA